MAMDVELERKIALVHAFAGVALGVVFGLYLNTPELTILSVLLLGFILSYPLKILSMKLFNLSKEEFLLKDWLGKGYFIFVTVWIVVWVFIFNMR
jgi:hypothetical protein